MFTLNGQYFTWLVLLWNATYKWFETCLVAAAKKSTEVLHNELPLEENINREIIEEGARGVDEAITLLRYAHSLCSLSTLLYNIPETNF